MFLKKIRTCASGLPLTCGLLMNGLLATRVSSATK
jgi:hypothetical protein